MPPPDTIIRPGDDIATVINVFDVDASKQQQLLDLLSEGTEQVMQHRPGFILVSLLAGNDGTRVVNYAQWRTLEDIKAIMADTDARKAAELAQAQPHVYTVVSTYHA